MFTLGRRARYLIILQENESTVVYYHTHSVIKPLDFILIKLLILSSSMIFSNDNIFELYFDLQQQREKESACIRVEVLNCIYHQCN